MASTLPSKHPHLALHLTDRALTPIISSSHSHQQRNPSSSSSSSSPPPPATPTRRRPPHHPPHQRRQQRQQATFSTSPPPPTSSSDEDQDDYEDQDDDDDDDDDGGRDPRSSYQARSLAHLTSTSLASYDTAKRFGRGAPLRTMVEYPSPSPAGSSSGGSSATGGGAGGAGGGGPVVLHSYLCPMSLALGTPGRAAQQQRRGSDGSMVTAVGAGAEAGAGSGSTTAEQGGEATAGSGSSSSNHHHHHHHHHTDSNNNNNNSNKGKQVAQQLLLSPLQTDEATVQDGDDDEDGPNAPPMLISTVVAPSAQHLRDARKAAGRLEKIARVFQTEWASVGQEAGT